MAISTYKTYLMYKAGESGEYSKLCDISAYPDLGGDPENIDVTTLSDPMRKFIAGIQSNDSMTFDAFYDKDTFTRLYALKGKTTHLAVWFGATGEGADAVPDGSMGKFVFDGEVVVRVAGAGVNEAVPMSIVVIPNTPITFETT